MHLRQYSLRSLLIVVLLVGPAICLYRECREKYVWARYDSTRADRKIAQETWILANENKNLSHEHAALEQAARKQYFTARDKAALASAAVDKYYAVDGIVDRKIVSIDGQRRLIPYDK